ncbi:DUF4097 family beta strand repeat-containing protein [Streptococcus dentapri]|uniref:DUF4097 family beta strand repeat-containing protein n=1 Tax=Streptococcus dentapri TaxID=573564 RepID=A0ABV8CZ13_9STRE
MKKSHRILLISALGCALLGSLLIGFGISAGGVRGIRSLNGKVERKEVPLDRVTSLTIKAEIKDIQIRRTADKQASLIYYKKEKESFSHDLSDGKLTINQTNNSDVIGFKITTFFGWLQNHEADKLVINLPKDTSLKDVAIDADAGNLTLENQSISTFHLEQDLGDVTIKNSLLSNANIKVDSGNLNLDNLQIDSGKIDTNLGDLAATNLTINKALAVNTDMGNTAIALSPKSKAETSVTATVDLGDKKISSDLIQGKTGKSQLTIEGDTGDIEVN